MLKIEMRGTLRFWGDWFGRPYDNWHVAVKSVLKSNECVIYFASGEICIVSQPVGIVSTKEEFYIKDAAKIVWQWNYYGKPDTAKNKRTLQYIHINDVTVVKNETVRINPKNFYAMEIL